MKKILCFILSATLLLTPTSIAFAKQGNSGVQHNKQQTTQQEKSSKVKEKVTKMSFKMNGSPVVKYGKYKLPIRPITKGMGATVNFDKATAILTVAKGTTTIVIDFKNKTVTVNGVPETKSGIFTAKSSKKTTVLIKYIAKALGVRVSVDKDKVVVEVLGLDVPTNVTVTPVGTTIVANTLNSTTLYLTATANITAGQATKAELYVGNKLVATDSVIATTDTTVTFTTADETPINAELQTVVPKSGVVTVKLYNADNRYVTSVVANPKLTVDYVAPGITSVSGSALSVTGSAITLAVTGAGANGDSVDVTKISVYDTALGKSYQLTNNVGTGSTGVVLNEKTIVISLGSADKLGLSGFGSSTMYLTIAMGSLLNDTAGNTSATFTSVQAVPVTLIK